jgi:hypothetical protein
MRKIKVLKITGNGPVNTLDLRPRTQTRRVPREPGTTKRVLRALRVMLNAYKHKENKAGYLDLL